MTSVFASPTLARWLASFTLLMNLMPARLPPRTPKPRIAPAPSGRYFLRECVAGVIGQARIIHPLHGRVDQQPLRQRLGVLDMPFEPDSQCLNPQQDEKRGERTLRGAGCPAAGACGHRRCR